jgi:anthranilate phosphoribosyltransferase
MFTELIEKLTRHEDLSAEEAAAAMGTVMDGGAAPAHIAALLVGLAMKGERPEELVGLARAMRAHAVRLSRRWDDVFDTCGTGGDRSNTFNISSCAALVVAAAGVRVAKHGNRSASSRTGGADVYEALGRQSSSGVLQRRASASFSRPRSIHPCATPRPCAASSACGPHSICWGRSPILRARPGSWSACLARSSPS